MQIELSPQEIALLKVGLAERLAELRKRLYEPDNEDTELCQELVDVGAELYRKLSL